MFLLQNIPHKAIISNLGHLLLLLSTKRIFSCMTLIIVICSLVGLKVLSVKDDVFMSAFLYIEQIFSKKIKKTGRTVNSN